MKDCNDCAFAEWSRTEKGKLSPTGDGKCTFKWEMPPLPESMYFTYGKMAPHGGYINRRQMFEKDCACFQRIKP